MHQLKNWTKDSERDNLNGYKRYSIIVRKGIFNGVWIL